MNGKIITLVIGLVIIIASFGAIGTNTKNDVINDCGCSNSTG